MIKQVLFKIQGMQRDLSVSAFNPNFAFENMNIRLTAREDNTLLSITNEKGNKEITTTSPIQGIPIGYSIINNYLVIFTHDGLSNDNIYRLELNNDIFISKRLFTGNLNFDLLHPIETIPFYETEDILKVYWIDGKNQTRVINIMKDDNDSFDFVATLKLKENITVKRLISGSGIFPAGTVQYVFTYYKLYGLETAIFHATPLNYISYEKRGGSSEDSINNSFAITLNNLDTNFDYIRIYSIVRTTINAVPTIKRIVDLKVEPSLYYVDNNTEGDVIDNTLLLYLGGEEVIPQAFTHKDNTLFLGNIRLNRLIINKEIRDQLKNGTISFENKKLYEIDKDGLWIGSYGLYPYNILLLKNRRELTTFKYLEWYRFGLLFLHKTGKWSEPIWVNDAYNTLRPDVSEVKHNYSKGYGTYGSLAYFNLSNYIVKLLKSLGYERVRGVVVYPNLSDREVIAQGVVNPTLFNVEDKENNSPGSISSWFFRGIPVVSNNYGENTNVNFTSPNVTGNMPEFRHGFNLPINTKANSEILCNMRDFSKSNEDNNAESNANGITDKDIFIVDTSVLTMHSPELLDNDIITYNNSKLKFRIIGRVLITGNHGNLDVTTSSSFLSKKGVFKNKSAIVNNYDFRGGRILMTAPYWGDCSTHWNDGDKDSKVTNWVIYPWHANRPLNDSADVRESTSSGNKEIIKYGMLDKKILSNYRYCGSTQYLKTPWLADLEDSIFNYNGITPINIFNSNEIVATKIEYPTKVQGIENNIYYGNYDKVINNSPAYLTNKSIDGYGLVETFNERDKGSPSLDKYLKEPYHEFKEGSNISRANDPIRMKFKSTPHFVFGFNYRVNTGISYTLFFLPTYNNLYKPSYYTSSVFWNPEMHRLGAMQSINEELTTELYYPTSFLWLGELYNDEVLNRFGGQTEEAFLNNLWLPSGETFELGNGDIKVIYNEGDTYIQRYDCLKTYPFTKEDLNLIIEVLSFCCETRVNIDGRYDRNRGLHNSSSFNPTNFNLFNMIYSQKDNFFNYRGLNYNLSQVNNFPNTITWTAPKLAGATTDAWTNLVVTSTIDVDGDKGLIISLKTFNDNIIGFLDRCIFNVLFNSRTLIPVSDGVPIEISNSGKVEGKRNISDIGTTNKWSIVLTPLGLYFMDTLNKDIYLFNGLINNLSASLGFTSWALLNITLDKWNPQDWSNFTSYYDTKNKDIYFTNNNISLCYSERIGLFSSFFNYERVSYMFNLGERFISLKDNTLWFLNEGEYNSFYGLYKPYYTTIVVNPEMPTDKIFNNIEFRADKFNNNELVINRTLDNLKVWNEYLVGESTLTNIIPKPSNLKEKFRIWRSIIPRDNYNPLNRIRNPWIYLRLGNFQLDNYKTILHDIIVNYTI